MIRTGNDVEWGRSSCRLAVANLPAQRPHVCFDGGQPLLETVQPLLETVKPLIELPLPSLEPPHDLLRALLDLIRRSQRSDSTLYVFYSVFDRRHAASPKIRGRTPERSVRPPTPERSSHETLA